MANDPYPVFKGSTTEQQRSRGGGGGGSVWRIAKGVLVGLVVMLAIAVAIRTCRENAKDEAKHQAQGGVVYTEKCDAGAAAREAWITTPMKSMEGYAPSTFLMSATGTCAATLRIREKDCSLRYLLEAYGSKPFMLAARGLGFRKLSCGYDEFDMTVITGVPAGRATDGTP